MMNVPLMYMTVMKMVTVTTHMALIIVLVILVLDLIMTKEHAMVRYS